MKKVQKFAIAATLVMGFAATQRANAVLAAPTLKIERIEVRNEGSVPYAFISFDQPVPSTNTNCTNGSWVTFALNSDLGKGMLAIAQSAMLAQLNVKVGFPSAAACMSGIPVTNQVRIGI